jgi:hypothetical protein
LACNTKSEKIEYWQANYQPLGFNFKVSLDNLEKKLIEQRIVVGNSKSDWIRAIMSLEKQEVDFKNLGSQIEAYIPAEPFYACIGEGKLLHEADLSEEEIKYGVLFSFYHVLSKYSQQIQLTLDKDQRIYVSGEETTIDELGNKLQEKARGLVDKGIELTKIRIVFSVDPEVKMELLHEVKQVLRKHDLTKIDITITKTR